MHQEVRKGLALGLAGVSGNFMGIEGSRIGVETLTGFDQAANKETHQQSKCGYDLKVDECLAAHPTDFSHILHAGDTAHDRAENHKCDDHRDQPDEGVAKRLHCDGPGWAQAAQHYGGRNSNQDLYPKSGVKRSFAAANLCATVIGRGRNRG